MEKIPAVPGFVLYRVDNKQLYYNNGSKWQAISTKIEVSSENKIATKRMYNSIIFWYIVYAFVGVQQLYCANSFY